MALDKHDQVLVGLAKGGKLSEFIDYFVNDAKKGSAAMAGAAFNGYATLDESMVTRRGGGYGGGYSNVFNRSGGSSGGSQGGDFIGNTLGTAATIAEAGTTTMGNQLNFKEFFTAADLIGVAVDENSNKFRGWGNILSDVAKTAGSQLLQYLQQQSQLVSTINEKTGMTGEFSKNFRQEISESVPYALRLGISFDQITKAVANMVADSGRFKILSTETINKITLMSKVYFDSLEEAGKSLETFQKVSMGAYDAMGAIERIGKSSLSVGLNAKETTKIVVTNLDKLNQYGFKQGIDGLGKMAQQAQSLRMSLDGALTIAEKVMDPTQALALSAELQVVGGAIGDFNDPLKMMYMATNDVQGLQDALVESAESLASFNEESGRFEIVGADLRRLRAMQDATGVSAKELSEIAIQSAQRTAAAMDIDTSGLNVSDEDKEFLTNLAQMRDGRMVIEVPQSLRDQLGLRQDETTMALEDMDQGIVNAILQQRADFEKLSTEDIARQQVSLLDNIGRDLSFIAGTIRQRMGLSAEKMMEAIGFSPSQADKELKNITNDFVDFSKKTIDKGGEYMAEFAGGLKDSFNQLFTSAQTSGQTNTAQTSTSQSTTGQSQSTVVPTGNQTTGYTDRYNFNDFTPLMLNLEGTQKGLNSVGDVVKELQENSGKYKDKTVVNELVSALSEIKKDEKTYGKDDEYLVNILASYLSTTDKTGKEKSDLLTLLASQQTIINKSLNTEVKSVKPNEQQTTVPTEKEKKTEVVVNSASNTVKVENFDYLLTNTKKTSDVLEVTSKDKKTPTLVVKENPLMSNSIKELNSNISKEKDKRTTELRNKGKDEKTTKNTELSENNKNLKEIANNFVNGVTENNKKISVVSAAAESTINEVGNVFERGILSANDNLSNRQKLMDDANNIVSENQKTYLDNVLKTTKETLDLKGKQHALLGGNVSSIKLPEGELQTRREEQKSVKEEKTTPITENKKVEIVHHFKSDVILDPVVREIYKTPEFTRDVVRSYVERPDGSLYG